MYGPYEKNGDIPAIAMLVYQRVKSILLVISYPNSQHKKKRAGDLTGKTDLEIPMRDGRAGWR